MTSAIRNTITTALASKGISADGYGEYIDVAVEALAEREYTIVETVVAKAENYYGSGYGEKAQEILSETSLSVRPAPEPVVEEAPAEPLTTDEKIEKLFAAVNDLAGTVGKLATLAESKLGVTL